jgi:NADH-quinone oxidoreductase subunit G
VSAELFESVGLYNGLELEELAGHGVRWPARAPALARSKQAAEKPKLRRAAQAKSGSLLLGSYRSIWAGPEVEASPALQFLAPRQRVELSPADAAKLALLHGEEVLVSDDHGELRATVVVRDSAPSGTAFLERDLARDGANLLRGPLVNVRAAPSGNGSVETLLGEEELTPA